MCICSVYGNMKTTFIYKLIDPETNEVRYVGKSNNPKRRLAAHYNKARYRPTHKFNWIKALKDKGLKPILEVIEEVSIDLWKGREKFWIKFYKQEGHNLTNYTQGGDGLSFGNQTSFRKGDNTIQVVKICPKSGEILEFFESLKSVGCGHIGHVLDNCKKSIKGFPYIKYDTYKSMSEEEIFNYLECFNSRYSNKTKTSFKKGMIPWNKNKSGYKTSKRKPVIQIDKSGNVLKEFECCEEAARYMGANTKAIRACLLGRSKTSCGYIWKYK